MGLGHSFCLRDSGLDCNNRSGGLNASLDVKAYFCGVSLQRVTLTTTLVISKFFTLMNWYCKYVKKETIENEHNTFDWFANIPYIVYFSHTIVF